MKNDEFSETLELRTRQFAIAILKLSLQLSKNPKLDTPCDCVVRSGVSVGANYWEAFRLKDVDEYRNHISQCEKDTLETIYWLEIIEDFKIADAITMLFLRHEARELLVVFTALLESKKLAG